MNESDKEKEFAGIEFGTALYYLKLGFRVSRRGWNGKNQWISMTPGRVLDVDKDNIWTKNVKKAALENGGKIESLPYLIMKNAQNQLQIGWLASQTDLFAKDWYVLSEDEIDG